ncbi:MAG TPA: glycosyltransferase family 4 protein [Terriglobia bacterium]|nr:glycosyltransferase family 4 protein [Terriglobia bacterium]
MKIAQVAPLYESVPPKFYGGTERVVSYLTEELVREGHDVSLFASGDSVTAARLFPQCPRALRLDANAVDLFASHIVMLEQVIQRASDFDLIHFHIDYLHFPWSRRQPVPNLTTLHGRLDIPDLVPLYGEFREMPVVSISDAQRQPLPWINWQATIHHGLPLDYYRLHDRPGDYLAFLGRICPEKRVDRAIEIAKRFGMKLRIAAKVDKVDREYFKDVVKPLLDQPFIEFVGEIGEHEKNDFLGGALAVLSPVDWPEPFGLVMIEAMACGTPVIAFRRGSAAEVVDDGVTGYVVDDIDQAVEAVGLATKLDRSLCRKVFERRFSVGRMALDYTRVYERVCQQRAAEEVGGIVVDYAVGPPSLDDEAAISDASQDAATGGLEDFR